MKDFKDLKGGDMFIAKLNKKHEAYDEGVEETFHAMKVIAIGDGEYKEYVYDLDNNMAYSDIDCYDITFVIGDNN